MKAKAGVGRSVPPPPGMVRAIINVEPAVWRAYQAAAKAAGYRSASDAIRDHLEAGPLQRKPPAPAPRRTAARPAPTTARAQRIASAMRRRERAGLTRGGRR